MTLLIDIWRPCSRPSGARCINEVVQLSVSDLFRRCAGAAIVGEAEKSKAVAAIIKRPACTRFRFVDRISVPPCHAVSRRILARFSKSRKNIARCMADRSW
jgi:hypothetical protein